MKYWQLLSSDSRLMNKSWLTSNTLSQLCEQTNHRLGANCFLVVVFLGQSSQTCKLAEVPAGLISSNVSLQENPYVMLKANYQELEGNERYEGFCVDMLKELADILKFNYRIKLVSDGVYGVPGANGTWTGMVGELIARVSSSETG